MPRRFLRRWLKRKPTRPSAHYLQHKEEARRIIYERLSLYAPLIKVTVKRVAIRNQRRRWGSCSSLGNLNFNYRTAFLPTELLDYIVVHELCHLRELNHSPAFWALVESILPDYQSNIAAIKAIEKEGVSRLSPKKSAPIQGN